ncbi:MAG: L-serine ammonia-lyase, iron-sulfur-dependent, subunit alpha [Firmicutes bacterium]|jgi:L-serine dehydratase|nr:L-serine ammonia-lyase, iron-sulfur-dependent, subunit alpha [Bacillota bacterium]
MSYQFYNAVELKNICKKENMSISQVMISREVENSGRSRDEIISEMSESIEVMKSSIQKGISSKNVSMGGLLNGTGLKLWDYAENNEPLSGKSHFEIVAKAMAVLEVNASMGKVVAAPTAGSCGILPATIITVAKQRNISNDLIINAMFNASAIGYLIAHNATVSGAEGGCQAETGAASAMAASALVEMMGGTMEQCLSAAAFTLKNIMGLVCDPIAGLVECPCQKRNGIGASNALISADMAMAGLMTIIPFDEVVEAMYIVGKVMSPSLKETAQGGIAATETGKRIEGKIFGK